MDMPQAKSQYTSSAFVAFSLSCDDGYYLICISTNWKQIHMSQKIAVFECTWQLPLNRKKMNTSALFSTCSCLTQNITQNWPEGQPGPEYSEDCVNPPPPHPPTSVLLFTSTLLPMHMSACPKCIVSRSSNFETGRYCLRVQSSGKKWQPTEERKSWLKRQSPWRAAARTT